MRHPYCLALAAALAWAAPPAAAQDEPPAPWRLFGVTWQPADAARIMEALGKGADPNATDANGNTSVHYAAGYSADVLRAVIAHGGRCDAKNSYGETPFHVAAAQGALDPGPDTVRVLVDCSPSTINEPDAKGNTPLHALYLGGDGIPHLATKLAKREDVLEALLEGGAEPNARNQAQDTPMLRLLKERGALFTYLSHLRLLLKHGADPDTRDAQGTPALVLTIRERPGLGEEDVKELVAALLKAGADPDGRDRRGDTPLLHLAKGEYDRPELEVLLGAGADPCLADRGGRVPWELAGELPHTRKELERAGGKPDPETGVCPRAAAVAAEEEKALGLARAERRRIQACLKAEGFDPGPADGAFGPRTRAAVRGWQEARGEGEAGAPKAAGYLTRAHADALSGCAVAAGPEPACTGKEKEGEGCWMELGNQPGCWTWNPFPAPEETVTWSGGCTDGKPSGKGEFVWRFRKDGEWKTSGGRGELQAGVRRGHWISRFSDGEVWEGRFVDGKRHGLWVRRGSGGRDWSCWYYGQRKDDDRACVKAEDLVMQVAATGARMRSGPRGEYEELGRLDAGEKVEVTGSAGPWRRVEAPGGGEGLRFVQASKLEEVAGGAWSVGEVFRECPECPEMVVVPEGSFMMGSPESEEGRSDYEGPVHRVTFERPFAVGVYEVTFGEWDACVSGGGCGGHRPDDWGWGRGSRPVKEVSWEDAQAYVRWLSGKTGEEYRLLSESEWEYVARAGTTGPYHFGSSISPSQANYGDYSRTGKTVPVGSYSANGFGLYDVHGNVKEWVEDCPWSYDGAPSDGSAWESGDCDGRMMRGGSWRNSPENLRSAYRSGWTGRHPHAGFRVARTLD